MRNKKKKNKILVIHGPNLHLLGKREPEVYGKCTLTEINKELRLLAKRSNVGLVTFQSNAEGEIVEKITNTNYDFLIINTADRKSVV